MSLRFGALAGLLVVASTWMGCATGNPQDDGSGGATTGGGDPCASLEDGQPCGNGTTSDCDKPNSCLAGKCVENFELEGVLCGEPVDTECDPADRCDGMGTCVASVVEDGTPCGDPTENGCTAPDTCDGTGFCREHNRPVGYGCGDQTSNECTEPDVCDGEGTCLTNDAPEGTACGDDTDNGCTDPDTCDGAGFCQNNNEASGTACGDQTDNDCTDPDTCDGAGTCEEHHELPGIACGDTTTTQCNAADACDGAGTCLANLAMNTTMCTDCSGSAPICGGCMSGTCTSCPEDELATLMTAANGINGIMFDVVAKTDLTLRRAHVNLEPGPAHDITIFYISGGYTGNESSPGNWTSVGTAQNVTSAGTNVATEIPLDIDLAILQGQRFGIYVHTNATRIWYADGTTLMAPTSEGDIHTQNTELQIHEGRALPAAFGTLQFAPRVFEGTLEYTIGCL